MTHPRLSLARDAHLFDVPIEGDVVVSGAALGLNLSDLGGAVQVISPMATDHAYWAARGVAVALVPPTQAKLAVVFLPRSKALARGLIAQALAVCGGVVVIDGQKTDGIDSILKDARKRGAVSEVISKAHGKLFVLRADAADFADWVLPDAPQAMADGFVTRAGVFSADAVDPASRLLADHLPVQLGRRVADLGAGWGYLAARVLERADITELHLVEVDHTALDCARANVTDPRARFHWADATAWRPETRLDAVVMNPPFHTSRSADPDLGRGFIAAAAACLAPHGRLYMVANRHLPYEGTLAQHFGQVEEIAGDNRFKVVMAARPNRSAT